jgi:hypothetical protein
LAIDDDFHMFHEAGVQFWNNYSLIYEVPGFLYLPSFAVVSAFLFAPLPLWEAHFVLFSINLFLGIIFVIELDKIYELCGLKSRLNRLLFLSVSTASWFVYIQFYHPQAKLIVGVILFYILRKTLEFRKAKKEKTYLNYFIEYFLLSFALGISPYLIFMVFLLILDDIGSSNLLKKESIKKYLLFGGIFLAQNILFVISPNIIMDYITAGFGRYGGHPSINLFYVREWLSFEYADIVENILTGLLLVFCIILGISRLKLPVKIGISSLLYLLLGTFGWSKEFIFISLLFLLLIPYVKQGEFSLDLAFDNFYIYTGMFCIFFINIQPVVGSTILGYLPFLQNFPFILIFYVRYLIFFIIFILVLITIYKTEEKQIPIWNEKK